MYISIKNTDENQSWIVDHMFRVGGPLVMVQLPTYGLLWVHLRGPLIL